MRDLISIEDLSLDQVHKIHSLAKDYSDYNKTSNILNGKILVNFFFENSTRTRTSFEIAAKRLGGEVVNVDISLSSLKKGESIADTAKTINAMKPDFVAIRHNSSGMVALLKKYINAPLINAGDGTNEHPTQALLDTFVIKESFRSKKNADVFKDLQVLICGDIYHSRVAHSNIKLLTKLGAKVAIATPRTLVPASYKEWVNSNYKITIFDRLSDAISSTQPDVVMMLRIQQERMSNCYIPSLEEYFKYYGLSHSNLHGCEKTPFILHPGPINRNVEISAELADDTNVSLILSQVEHGISVRKAILSLLVE